MNLTVIKSLLKLNRWQSIRQQSLKYIFINLLKERDRLQTIKDNLKKSFSHTEKTGLSEDQPGSSG
jgi:hypothetical protein